MPTDLACGLLLLVSPDAILSDAVLDDGTALADAAAEAVVSVAAVGE